MQGNDEFIRRLGEIDRAQFGYAFSRSPGRSDKDGKPILGLESYTITHFFRFPRFPGSTT